MGSVSTTSPELRSCQLRASTSLLPHLVKCEEWVCRETRCTGMPIFRHTHLWGRKSKMFAVSFSEKSEKASQHAAMLHIWQRFFVHKWSNVAGRCIGFRHLWRRSFPTSRETCTAACTPSPLMERLPRKTVENCVLKF